MEAKRIKGLILSSFFLIGIIGCQKKVKKIAPIIDKANSQYSNKNCFGKAIENQWVISWTMGGMSLFKGSKTQLLSYLASIENNSEISPIRMIEQDREVESLDLNLRTDQVTEVQAPNEGIYWQVWGQEDIQANKLWDQNIKGNRVTVAVVDAGIDLKHPALTGRVAVNINEIPDNGIDDDKNGLVDDYKGFDFAYKSPTAQPSQHGTHVAGIIAAEPFKNPMLGVAPEAQLIPLNIMSDRGGGSLSAAVFAIKYAQSRGAKIINASWGGAICADILRQTILDVGEAGVLFISAAGNDGTDIDLYPEFPAAFALPNQLTVGASVQSGLMAAFSNFGRERVDILAPGHQILSTVPGGWQIASGTSMATPFVSGVAALLWSAHPEATLHQVRLAIQESVADKKNYYPVHSKGRLNAPLALQNLEKLLIAP